MKNIADEKNHCKEEARKGWSLLAKHIVEEHNHSAFDLPMQLGLLDDIHYRYHGME